MHELHRTSNIKDHIKTDYKNLLKQLQKSGDNDTNIYGKTINDIFQSLLIFSDTKTLLIQNSPISCQAVLSGDIHDNDILQDQFDCDYTS